MKYLYYNFS